MVYIKFHHRIQRQSDNMPRITEWIGWWFVISSCFMGCESNNIIWSTLSPLSSENHKWSKVQLIHEAKRPLFKLEHFYLSMLRLGISDVRHIIAKLSLKLFTDIVFIFQWNTLTFITLISQSTYRLLLYLSICP